MKKYWFKNKVAWLIPYGAIAASLWNPVNTYAITLNTESFCDEFEPVDNQPLTIVGTDKKTYTVYYARRFTGCGATSDHADYYGEKEINLFYRKTYAKKDAKDNEFAISYQHIPESTYRDTTRTKDYDWDVFYESQDEVLASWRYGKVDRNTFYCGRREVRVSSRYPKVDWECNPSDKSGTGNRHEGQVSKTVGYNKSTKFWGGTSDALGESRFLGYNEYGVIVDNTYFPNDYPADLDLSNYHYGYFKKVQNKNVKPTQWDKATKGILYDTKRWAIGELRKQEPGLQNRTIDDLMEIFSLRNNPLTETGVFMASGKQPGSKNDFYIVVALNPPAEADRNLGIESLRFLDHDGEAISTMTRNTGTTEYEVSQHKTKKAQAGQTYQVEAIIKNSSPSVSSVETKHSIQVRENAEQEWVTKNSDQVGQIAKGGTIKVVFDYKVPVDASDSISLEAKINESYKQSGDNTFMDDDNASLTVNVEKAPEGDLILKDIYLVDAKQSTSDKLVYADYPIQGVEYFVLYEVEYKGQNMKGAEFTIGINSTIDRHKVDSLTGALSSSQVSDLIKGQYPSTKTELDKGKLIYVKGQTFTATTSKINVDAKLVLGTNSDYKYNNDTNNDSMKESFYAPINLKINKVVVNPNSHPGGDYCGSFTIDYKADFNWASHVTRPNSEVQKVKVAYSVLKPNSNTYVPLKTETIKVYANRQNQEYVAKIDNKCIPEGSKIKVTINSDYQLHEGNISDNSKEYTWQATVNRKDYCAQTKKTSTRWTQSYVVLERKEGGYSNLVDILKSASNPIKVSNSESYEITAIWMSSKLMKDKGYGSAHSEGAGSGWVNALNPARGEEVIIKAGYAFDFQIEVKYQTNAYQNEKNHSQLNNLPSNKDVYNRLEKLPLNDDLYMKTSDGKLVSLTSTDIRFEKSTVGSVEDELIITYQLASRLSPNGTGEQVDGLFVNEDTKDGTYYLDVYTAPINGVPGKTTNEVVSTNPSTYKPLCDNDRISFKVKGSYRDDLNIGLIK